MVFAPLSVADDGRVKLPVKEEVADAELIASDGRDEVDAAVSDGPDVADAAVWADAEMVVVATASIFSRPAVIVTWRIALIDSSSESLRDVS